MGMSVQVYEHRDGWSEAEHYFAIVWRGRRRWSVPAPWDENKQQLREVGLTLRNQAYMDEQYERILANQEKEKASKERGDEADHEAMVRDCKRTIVNKPQYYY